ncbi:hypothetical protein BZA05DRAFT_163144 [Tricharina praecox]|uniref:uncharacterized protein n=1 Tax=Tricharina praecox TaxID=43433 RepID=UPI0022204076|nr:uncharacterized protein BZA05DRAFT_163144 [Tricharina praecox]KAI5856963.1 hypothetical protein BZA05DRAFT_163144 [Tricharina praecox]
MEPRRQLAAFISLFLLVELRAMARDLSPSLLFLLRWPPLQLVDHSSSLSVFFSTAYSVQPLPHGPHFLGQHQLSARPRTSIRGGGYYQAVLFPLGAFFCTSPPSHGLERQAVPPVSQLSQSLATTSTACRGSIRSDSSSRGYGYTEQRLG